MPSTPPNKTCPSEQLQPALALHQAGRLKEAMAGYADCLEHYPDDPQLLYLAGTVDYQMGNTARAIVQLERSLELNPRQIGAWSNLGVLFHQEGRFEAALESYDHALLLKPQSPQVLNNRGITLCALGRLEEGVKSYEEAIRLQPGNPEALCNRGNALKNLQQFEAALANYEQAIRLDSQDAGYYSNRALVLLLMGRLQEAEESCHVALRYSPGHREASFNLALIKLTQGDYAKGWGLYEFRTMPLAHKKIPTALQWRGAQLVSGKKIFIYPEHRKTDFIQFCRYVGLVASRGMAVILQVPKPLFWLIHRSVMGQNIRVTLDDVAWSDVDAACPIMSLPLAFETTVENIPATVPYLVPDPIKQHSWAETLSQVPGLRVGIVWAGSQPTSDPDTQALNARRDIPVELLSVLNIPGITFYSLQQGEIAQSNWQKRVAQGWEGPDLIDHTDQLHDFDDMAALIANLDLVVGADTSVVHLAGALGKPVWVLNRHDACWRWLQGRTDSPWYPTATVFRQPIAGDWASVMASVRARLLERLQEQRGHQYEAEETFTRDAASNRASLLAEADRCYRAGDWDQAAQHYAELLPFFERNATFLSAFGMACYERGDYARSLSLLDRALAMDPDQPMVWSNRGVVLQAQSRFEEALSSYDQAIYLQPDYFNAHNNRAGLLFEQERYEASLAAYDQAIVLRPDNPRLYASRSHVLKELQQEENALRSIEQAIALNPEGAEYHFARGALLGTLGRVDEALESYDTSLKLDPESTAAHSNRGLIFLRQRKLAAARQSFEAALSCDRDSNTQGASFNLGILELLEGHFDVGWPLYEFRQVFDFGTLEGLSPELKWRGEFPAAGKTLFIFPEQGLGDFIQFCRYVFLLEAAGANIIFGVPDSLLTLMREAWPGRRSIRILSQQEPVPLHDGHCPLLSLPLVFKTTLENIPADIPYLEANQSKAAIWGDRLSLHAGFRVGLVWSGAMRPDQPELLPSNARRNMPLRELVHLKLPGVVFFSLQKGEEGQQLADLVAQRWGGPEIIDYTADLEDFSDTAALIENLDLVISVDTAVLHLASAMGKQVWLLDRFDNCWRWLLNRTTSPWYPNLRIFRQTTPGDWKGVVDRVLNELSREVSATHD